MNVLTFADTLTSLAPDGVERCSSLHATTYVGWRYTDIDGDSVEIYVYPFDSTQFAIKSADGKFSIMRAEVLLWLGMVAGMLSSIETP